MNFLLPISNHIPNSDNSHMHLKQGVTILYFNARSLVPKLDDLRLECVNRQPDIVCIVETWLENEVSDNEVPDYQD